MIPFFYTSISYYKENNYQIFFDEKNIPEVVSYRLHERIVFLETSLIKGSFFKTLERQKNIKHIKVNHYDPEGNIILCLEGDCEFINTWGGLSGNYNSDELIKLKTSFVLKNLTIREYIGDEIKTERMF